MQTQLQDNLDTLKSLSATYANLNEAAAAQFDSTGQVAPGLNKVLHALGPMLSILIALINARLELEAAEEANELEAEMALIEELDGFVSDIQDALDATQPIILGPVDYEIVG